MSTLAIAQGVNRLESPAVVSLFVLDGTSLGGDLLRFFPAVTNAGAAIVWQGQTYSALPVEVRGFEFQGQGSPPRPSLTFGNVDGAFTALCLAFDDLIGARFIRKRTFANRLDGEALADPTAAYPDDIFYVNRLTLRNKFSVEFELVTAMELDDVVLPKRKIVANICAWRYRGEGCGYAEDTALAGTDDVLFSGPKTNRGEWSAAATYSALDFVYTVDSFDRRRYFYCKVPGPITGLTHRPTLAAYWTPDQCSKRIAGCVLRFGTDPGGLPYGGFAAADRQNS